MSTVEKAFETQLANIQKRTGKTLAELGALIEKSGLKKHGEIREMLKRDLGMGHGDANTLAHYVSKSGFASRGGEATGAAASDVLDGIYTGAKTALRPIHEKLMESIRTFGDFDVAPKKGYVSLRRKKQFAMLGPATNTRFEVGLNGKDLGPSSRLEPMPPASMCHFKVKLSSVSEVDDELISLIRAAYDRAG